MRPLNVALSRWVDLLELVQALLPTTVTFYSDLYTSKYDLLTPFEIYSKLYDVSVIDRVGSTFHSRTTQTDMIEESA